MSRRKSGVAMTVVAALGVGGCSSDSASNDVDPTTTRASTTTTDTTTVPTTQTSVPLAPPSTARRTTRTTQRRATTTSSTVGRVGCAGVGSSSGESTSSSSSSPTTTSTTSGPPPTAIVVCGRPYRRRLRRGLMLPDVIDLGPNRDAGYGDVPDEARARVASLWLGDARSEAASVPAFAELALHLAAVGAPTHLVAGAHEAALDEIRHAQRCLEVASRLLGRTFALGALPEIAGRRVAGRFWWSRRRHLVKLATASLLDGCISEANSAEHLRDRGAHSAAEIGATARALASDEDRHAALAWEVVEWCRAQGGAAVDRALERTLRRLDWTDDLVDSARARLGVRELQLAI